MVFIFGAMLVTIIGLAFIAIGLWGRLQEERARTFNAKLFNRIVAMEQHPSVPVARPRPYDQDAV